VQQPAHDAHSLLVGDRLDMGSGGRPIGFQRRHHTAARSPPQARSDTGGRARALLEPAINVLLAQLPERQRSRAAPGGELRRRTDEPHAALRRLLARPAAALTAGEIMQHLPERERAHLSAVLTRRELLHRRAGRPLELRGLLASSFEHPVGDQRRPQKRRRHSTLTSSSAL
jgi:hypothetical protein